MYLGSSLLGTAAGIGIGMGISYSATNTLTASIKDIRWGYAIKAAVKGNYTKVLKLSTFNPNSDYVALGRFINETSPKSYINIAKANGYTYFDMGKYYDFAKELSVHEKINKMFLKTQYDLGKKFICTSLDIAGSYANELKFLKSIEAFTKFIIF